MTRALELNARPPVLLAPGSDGIAEQGRLDEERAEEIRANLALVIAGNTAAALLTTVLLWDQFPYHAVGVWFLAIATWNLWGISHYAEPSKREAADSVRFIRKYEIDTGVSGVMWGCGFALAFLHGDVVHQALVVALMALVTTGAITSNYPTFRAAARFVCAVLLPTSFAALSKGAPSYWLLAAALVLLCVICLQFTRAQFADRSRQTLLRFRNEALARELASANARLEEAGIAKTRFLAAANHDLRQPMHAIGLLIGALRGHPQMQSSGEALSIIEKIQASIEIMDNLFATILDISRLDARVVEPQIESFPLSRITDNLELHYGPVALQKGVRLKVVRTGAVVTSDPSHLERIIRNFVSNAIRYTDRGGVLVGFRKRDAQIEVQVWDTGVGIALDQQEIVFHEFVQLGNPTHDRSRGLGLGLSIAQRLATVLSHPIGLKSTPGKGTMFFVRVPLSSDAFIETQSPSETIERLKSLVRGTFVVVIDDEESILYGMQRLLRGYGCPSVCAPSGREVLDALREHQRQPDLIISDFRIGPLESGIDVIRSIRQHQDLQIPAVVMTGSSDEVESIAASDFVVVQKPVTEFKLLMAMADALRLG